MPINSIDFGPKVPIWGVLQGQSICYLGTWTLGGLGFWKFLLRSDVQASDLNQAAPLETLQYTNRLHSSSFLGSPYRILNMNHKKELLWSLWVPSADHEVFGARPFKPVCSV